MFDGLKAKLRHFRSELGQTMSEYAVVLMMISSTTVVLFPQLASNVGSAVTSVARLLP